MKWWHIPLKQVRENLNDIKISNVLLCIIAATLVSPFVFPVTLYGIDTIAEKSLKYDITNDSEIVVIPEGTIILSSNKHYNINAQHLYLPKTLKEIPPYFFEQFNSNLTDIYYGGTWREWFELLNGKQIASNVTITFEVFEDQLYYK